MFPKFSPTMISPAMVSNRVQASNCLIMIARLNRLTSEHLQELMYCRREMLRCITERWFSESDREALRMQMKSLQAQVAQWHEEILFYQEQYERLSGRKRHAPAQALLFDEKPTPTECCDEDAD